MLIQLINLDRSPERLQQFTAVNGHLTNVERFPAIDGGRQDIAALTRNGTIEEAVIERYTAGNLGLALTPLTLWEKAIAAGGGGARRGGGPVLPPPLRTTTPPPHGPPPGRL